MRNSEEIHRGRPSRLARAGLLAAASLVAVLVVAGPAHAGFPGSNGDIVFASWRDGYSQIYAMGADGSNERSLSNDPSAMYFDPAWSPDGTRVALATTRDGNSEIYVMNADGTGMTRLTDHWATDGFPSWSPDGTRIAFASTRDGNWDIWLMAPDGTGLENVTNNDEYNSSPAWSPDGTRIAFHSVRRRALHTNIYVMGADGSGQTQLTFTPNSSELRPVWSPDGSRLAYTGVRARSGVVYTMSSDGSGVVRLGEGSDPAWSPDGAKLAFSSFASGAGEIVVMNTDGSGRERLTFDGSVDKTPDWQPVG